jgi:hypothetical protein
MSDDNTRDGAEPSPASAGSQPVAWAAVFDGEVDAEFVWPFMADALAWAAARPGVEIVPLYRHPQPTLTDEEREAIEWSILQAEATIGMANEQGTIDGAAKTIEALRGLLERLK